MTNLRAPVFAAAAFALVAGVTACGDDSTSSPPTTTAKPAATATTTTTPGATTAAPTTNPANVTAGDVYFVRDGKIGVARRSVLAASPAKDALTQLLTGPAPGDKSAGLSTSIPAGTRLLRVDIAAQGKATVDLSTEFGNSSDPTATALAVAQIVYTLTQFDNVIDVTFHVDGKAVDALGDDSVHLDRPQTRNDWESVTPAILVESPLPGDTLTNPFHVTGTADTFEATFMIRLTDSAGRVIYENHTTATSGTGTRGTFDQQITFIGAQGGAATLRAWETSAQDGSDTNVVSIPVTLAV